MDNISTPLWEGVGEGGEGMGEGDGERGEGGEIEGRGNGNLHNPFLPN